MNRADLEDLEHFLHRWAGVQHLSADIALERILSLYSSASTSPTLERNVIHLEYLQQAFPNGHPSLNTAPLIFSCSKNTYQRGPSLLFSLSHPDQAIQQEVEQAGLCFVSSAAYNLAWQRSLLLRDYMSKVLGVGTASPSIIATSILQLHQMPSMKLTSNQCMHHLTFINCNCALLLASGPHDLGSLRIPTDQDVMQPASSLFSALPQQFESLQRDLRSSGMQFVAPEV